MASRILGLDIGRFTVKAVIVEGTARAWRLVEVHEEAIDDDAATAGASSEDAPDGVEAAHAADNVSTIDRMALGEPAMAALRALAERGLFAVDGVVTALSAGDAVITRLALPFAGAREIQAVLGPQLEGRLPAEVADLLIDFERGAQLAGGDYVVYTAGVAPELVAVRLGELQAVGVDPRALGVPPFHLRGLVELVAPDVAGPVAVVDIGADDTSVVVARGGELQYARSFSGGGERVTDALAAMFGLDAATAREGKHREGFIDPAAPVHEAPTGDDATDISDACRRASDGMLRQLRRTFHAHAAEWGAGVERVVLVGGGAQLAGLADYLRGGLGVEVTVFEATHPALALDGFGEVAPRFASALAHALRGLGTPASATMNARTGPFSFRGSYDYVRTVAPQIGFGLVALAVLTMLFTASRFALVRAEEKAVDAMLSAATAELFGEAETDPTQIRRELTMRAARPGFIPEKSAYALLVTLSETVAETLDLGYDVAAPSVEIDMERRLFRVEGVADSAESVDMFQQTLGRAECFRQIERNDLSQRREGEGFEFTLQGVASCSPVEPADGDRQ